MKLAGAMVAVAGLILVLILGWIAVPADSDPGIVQRDVEDGAALLAALPYLAGHDPAPRKTSVVQALPGLPARGYNLYSSGHGPEAFLVDMEGRVVHRWSLPAEQAWPDLVGSPHLSTLQYWRRVELLPNGDLLAIFEGYGLIRIDWSSRLLWAHRGGNHHHMGVAPDGRIFVLARRGRKFKEPDQPERMVIEDTVQVLTNEGVQLEEISIPACFENSDYAGVLENTRPNGDVFHTNTLWILDGRGSSRLAAFRAGNLLISIREINTIAILDPVQRKVVWSMTGMWSRQHEPTILENGNILIFDNMPNRGRSRVIEIDPLTQEIVWSYGSEERNQRLFSATSGTAQRLPNGNTLIAESERGRAIEVTPDGAVVWEFMNPQRVKGGDLIAVLFAMTRLGEDFPIEELLQASLAGG